MEKLKRAILFIACIGGLIFADCFRTDAQVKFSPKDIQSISVMRQGDTLVSTIYLKNGGKVILNTAQTDSLLKKAKRIEPGGQINQNENKIYQFVQQMPQFPGGEAALKKYLIDNIHYPQVAKKDSIQGTVVVQFVVNTDGSIVDVKTVGAKKGGGLEEEAIRVVKNMPKWIPGKQDGKKVRVQYSLPVRFKL